MELTDIVALVPEDKRADVTAALSGVIKITSKADAEKLIAENLFVKSAYDAGISRAVMSHDERFTAEKLPKLVEDEISKRNPPKDPRDVKIAELERKMLDAERAALTEKQIARAVAKASELGIPAELARKYIGDSDEKTDAMIAELSGALTPWRDEAVKKAIVERVGNNGTPPRGAPGKDQITAMREAHVQLMNEKRFPEAQRLMEQIRQVEKE